MGSHLLDVTQLTCFCCSVSSPQPWLLLSSIHTMVTQLHTMATIHSELHSVPTPTLPWEPHPHNLCREESASPTSRTFSRSTEPSPLMTPPLPPRLWLDPTCSNRMVSSTSSPATTPSTRSMSMATPSTWPTRM